MRLALNQQPQSPWHNRETGIGGCRSKTVRKQVSRSRLRRYFNGCEHGFPGRAGGVGARAGICRGQLPRRRASNRQRREPPEVFCPLERGWKVLQRTQTWVPGLLGGASKNRQSSGSLERC